MCPSPLPKFQILNIRSKTLWFSHHDERVLPSTDKRESKSAVPAVSAVSASQITHFEDPELLFLLGSVRKHQCCHADATTASKSRLSKTPAD